MQLSCLQSLWSACPRHGLPGKFSLSLWVTDPVSLRTVVTDLLVPQTNFMEDNFSEGGAWFQDDLSSLHLLCILFLI